MRHQVANNGHAMNSETLPAAHLWVTETVATQQEATHTIRQCRATLFSISNFVLIIAVAGLLPRKKTKSFYKTRHPIILNLNIPNLVAKQYITIAVAFII